MKHVQNAEEDPGLKVFKTRQKKTKRRKTEELTNTTPQRLVFSTSRVLRMNGQPQLAKSLAQVNFESPSTSSYNTECSFSPSEALSLILDRGLSKRSYQNLRNSALEKKSKIFPSYNNVRLAKEDCLPSPPEEWLVTDGSAEVTLQDLLDHTTRRIFERVGVNHEVNEYRLICKMGRDGTTDLSIYKQIRSDNQEQNVVSESCFFVTCLVPLQLSGETEANEKVLVWKNNKPSSPFYCRPTRFKFVKETSEVLVPQTPRQAS
ncbi:uncharacterized protein LOC126993877 [Eriocheir sinensis]|uniref:uncharacterized protein LOC126993877 n=1 Tax=Eriocheir sinensis TaxID=95602 RepID=UPI0021CA2E25|nr:uncharacterized protein LOC126993877 [Eriocheir sinensis]